jgi:hypothetical protein
MLLTLIFWPISQLMILIGICLLFWMSDGGSSPDSSPFNGPKQTYYWFKEKYSNLFGGLARFVKREMGGS